MEGYDLNLDNYNLPDLLQLFNLNQNYTEADLKKSYKMVLKMHPDKSGLESKYFLFFSKAYKIIHKLYYYRVKKEKCIYNQSYQTNDIDKERNIKKFIESSSFNKQFNKMFEKVRLEDEEHDSGYGEWLKSNENIIDTKKNINLSQFKNEFEKQKQKCKSIIQYQGLKDLEERQNGSQLVKQRLENYSSDIFSKLKYEDVKKAHIESVIPITQDDINNAPRYNSLNEYQQVRTNQTITPMSLQQSKQYLEQQKNGDTQRMFKLIKQDEKIEQTSNKWWSMFNRLM